ncbi:13182_t:CDS:2 [Racocetra fulgida]|uniref:13182_t:CDS:1 n=1 Tax=Racocetra fulgida TaxID=60492 RepID=A0A9N8VS02_9GLOM|nr:13182_t:CDS:2 [Racocetra fulgida]
MKHSLIKNVVRNHLKKCKYFHAKLGSQEAVDNYCNKTANKAERNLQASKIHPNADDTSETTKFFKFLNSALTLPSQCVLSNCILDAERINYIKSQKQKLKEDGIEITLAFDG